VASRPTRDWSARWQRWRPGRFKGGYITRHYGDPAGGAHAVQLELSQINYMDEAPPYSFREDLAAGLRPVLNDLLVAALAWARRMQR
jgi:N-formylglutamate amidohydrolase